MINNFILKLKLNKIYDFFLRDDKNEEKWRKNYSHKDSIGMIRQRQVSKGDIDNYIDNEKDRDKEKDNDIMKQKVVSSFGRFDWYDQGRARATLLAERKREQGEIFSTGPLEGKVLNNFWLLLILQDDQTQCDYKKDEIVEVN